MAGAPEGVDAVHAVTAIGKKYFLMQRTAGGRDSQAPGGGVEPLAYSDFVV
jgi:hypothetical protein